jgi:hypothetical protein
MAANPIWGGYNMRESRTPRAKKRGERANPHFSSPDAAKFVIVVKGGKFVPNRRASSETEYRRIVMRMIDARVYLLTLKKYERIGMRKLPM